jgi:hypothetical protein
MTKTDNARPESKLALRRHFLQTYHAEEAPKVFDACQGEQVLWRELRREFPCKYWGVDVKPKEGRLAIDSIRILEQTGWDFDVIDIDTYGAPWRHWKAVLLNAPRKPITVFLTAGSTMFRGWVDAVAFEALGMSSIRSEVPISFGQRLNDIAVEYCLAMSYFYRWTPIDCREATPNVATRYIGIRLQPTH